MEYDPTSDKLLWITSTVGHTPNEHTLRQSNTDGSGRLTLYRWNSPLLLAMNTGGVAFNSKTGLLYFIGLDLSDGSRAVFSMSKAEQNLKKIITIDSCPYPSLAIDPGSDRLYMVYPFGSHLRYRTSPYDPYPYGTPLPLEVRDCGNTSYIDLKTGMLKILLQPKWSADGVVISDTVAPYLSDSQFIAAFDSSVNRLYVPGAFLDIGQRLWTTIPNIVEKLWGKRANAYTFDFPRRSLITVDHNLITSIDLGDGVERVIFDGGVAGWEPNAWTVASAQSIAIVEHKGCFNFDDTDGNGNPDNDGDGLCDSWETGKSQVNRNGQLLDLHELGADPDVKDIFVQVDSMASPIGPYEPSKKALEIVIDSFAKAPVDCSGKICKGIRLHIDAGWDSYDRYTGLVWGDKSKAKRLPYRSPLVTASTQGKDRDATALIELRAESFLALPNARQGIFRYVAYVDRVAQTDGPPDNKENKYRSGVTLLSGDRMNVMTVFASAPPLETGVTKGSPAAILHEASAFMHELGHQLGLQHGGLDDIGFKPNYLSVMNELFTIGIPRLAPPGEKIAEGRYYYVDYSRYDERVIRSLDESEFDETIPLTKEPELVDVGTKRVCNILESRRISDPIDFNCKEGYESSVNWNINGDKKINDDEKISLLHSFNDWSNLQYNTHLIPDSTLNSYAIADEYRLLNMNALDPGVLPVGNSGSEPNSGEAAVAPSGGGGAISVGWIMALAGATLWLRRSR